MSKLGEAVTAWRLNEDSEVAPGHADLASDDASRIRRKRKRKEGRTQRAKKRVPIHMHVQWKPAALAAHGVSHGAAHSAALGSSADVCEMQPRSAPANIQDLPAAQGMVTQARTRACNANAGAPTGASNAESADLSKPVVTDAQAKALRQHLQICTQHGPDDKPTAAGIQDVFCDGLWHPRLASKACLSHSPSQNQDARSKDDAE